MNQNDAFRLSRIEAEGWTTAHRVMAGETRELDDIRIADFNPYRSDPARARWLCGFRNAMGTIEAK